jgi:hypothetical protein
MIDSNFLIILFKNNNKKKIINKFVTHENANSHYKKLIEYSSQVIFPKKYENGIESNFDLCLISNQKKIDSKSYYKDSFGRQIKLELNNPNYNIINIDRYNIEEEFLDYKNKKKINAKKFIEKYLSGPNIKLVSKLNNKIVVQNDDKFNLFTLKNSEDAFRFLNCLTVFFQKNNKRDCLVVNDTSTTHRKYLYKILVENGFPKNYLFRHSTTHPTKK